MEINFPVRSYNQQKKKNKKKKKQKQNKTKKKKIYIYIYSEYLPRNWNVYEAIAQF